LGRELNETEPSLPKPLRQLDAGPVFVVGQPRSGTTWVYDILTAHPEVAGVLESELFSDRTGLGALLQRGRWGPRSLATSIRVFAQPVGVPQLVPYEEVVSDVRELVARWLSNALGPEDRFLVEKSPRHAGQVRAIADVFPEARFVCVLRDGRDAMLSARAAAGSWAPVLRKAEGGSVWRGARLWERQVRALREATRDIDNPCLEITYEELWAAPEEGAARLYSFCGLPHDAALIAEVVEATSLERRRRTDHVGFRRGVGPGAWRDQLSLPRQVVFEVAAGPALAECGYEPSRLWPLARVVRGALSRWLERDEEDRTGHPGIARSGGDRDGHASQEVGRQAKV
jgi:sulfotransferase family protein